MTKAENLLMLAFKLGACAENLAHSQAGVVDTPGVVVFQAAQVENVRASLAGAVKMLADSMEENRW